MNLTNEQGIGLSMSVFLASDDYDYDPRPNSVSTTGLLKSIRQIILTKRASQQAVAANQAMDISTLVASSFGTAVHDGIEKAWSDGRYKKAMRKLGYKEGVINRIVVNPGYIQDPLTGKLVEDPNAEPLKPDAIPIYMEIRTEKEIDGFIISGKFDFIGDGELEDHKTTGVYTYIKKTNDDKYREQGSIYRWLNPKLIISDRMLVNYTFTDFSALRCKVEKAKGYPPYKMMSVPINLMTLEETEKFIRSKIHAVKSNIHRDEAQLPLCTKEELWQDDTTYKYYKNPQLKTKSTKNFTNFAEAQIRLNADGGVGVIDIVYGEAKFCKYCNGAAICSQAQQLLADGLLNLD